MKDKFILETIDEEGNVITSENYKSYSDISKKIGCNYMCVRTINRITEGLIEKKFPHRELKHFLKTYRIRNIPF